MFRLIGACSEESARVAGGTGTDGVGGATGTSGTTVITRVGGLGLSSTVTVTSNLPDTPSVFMVTPPTVTVESFGSIPGGAPATEKSKVDLIESIMV